MTEITFSIAQDVEQRELQEDFCGYRFSNKLEILQGKGQISGAAELPFMAVLCDGMGGHSLGEIASKIAGKSFLVSTLAAFDGNHPPSQFKDIIVQISKNIRDHIAANHAFEGMGTALIGIKIYNYMLKWISIGDSHLYLVRQNNLSKLNADHSMKPLIDAMVNKSILTETEAKVHPDRNALRSALIGDELSLISIQVDGFLLKRGDLIILALDGVDALSIDRLANIIKFWKRFGLSYLAKKIIAAVLKMKHGHQDNVSLFVIKFYFHFFVFT